MIKVASAIISSIITIVGGFFGIKSYINYVEEQKWLRPCDGTSVTESCTADDGLRYTKYLHHEAEEAVTEDIVHPAEPAKTHIIHHEAVYGTRTINLGCVKTSISYKSGTCALSRCRDGEYSGSTGRGTCSYHGGVWYYGGPWYNYREERYVVTPAWDETVVDVPAKSAWVETVVVSEAKDAYWEKELAAQYNSLVADNI